MISITMDLASRFRNTVDHVRRLKTRRRAEQELTRSLALIVDPEALEASVASRLKEVFDPDILVILQLDPKSSVYKPSFSSGVFLDEISDITLAPRGRLARWFQVNESCLLVQRELGVVSYLEDNEQELLRRLDARLCAPLLARNYLVGILALGTRRNWRPGRRDAELLMRLANQASLAFQNASLYREQRQRLDRLHRADRLAAVGQLAAGVAHEVRNPLTTIRSTMQYLAQGFSEGPKQELVDELIGEVDRIDVTISDLLNLTRASELHIEDVELADLARQTIRLVESQARKQSVEIQGSYPDGEIRIQGDASRLKQVLLNLILNALQAMTEGGTIMVRARADRPPGRSPSRAVVEIVDDGPGIPRQQLERVFDPFFTTKREGTGLGLAICNGIIERHGGEIEIDSKEGEGTRVAILLPLETP